MHFGLSANNAWSWNGAKKKIYIKTAGKKENDELTANIYIYFFLQE